eukprot:16431498-Heterocapsa_arctica.AAC.1
MENIMGPWNPQGWSTSISEELAIRSLQGGTRPELQDVVQLMNDRQDRISDEGGQSDYNQTVSSWHPLITIGCSIPHFLRAALPPQLGEQVTSASLAKSKSIPK